jgi:hypothetical protein
LIIDGTLLEMAMCVPTTGALLALFGRFLSVVLKVLSRFGHDFTHCSPVVSGLLKMER